MAEMLTWPALASSRISRGHFAEPALAELRASPESREAYIALVPDRPMPDGATLAILHRDARTSIAGAVFVMQKHGGAWTYLVLSAEGEIRSQGAIGLCESCHSLAPADHLFGLPSETNPGKPDAGR